MIQFVVYNKSATIPSKGSLGKRIFPFLFLDCLRLDRPLDRLRLLNGLRFELDRLRRLERLFLFEYVERFEGVATFEHICGFERL